MHSSIDQQERRIAAGFQESFKPALIDDGYKNKSATIAGIGLMSEVTEQALPKTALVLDDEPRIGTMVCKVLSLAGIAAQHFTDPTAFLVEIKRSQPPLIVLDLALGQSDAVEVIRKLDVLKFPGIVLLISGRDEATLAEIERIGRSHGLWMAPYLRKPFRAAELKARLQTAYNSERPNLEKAEPPPAEAPQTSRIDLGVALRERWLEVWYQPKLDLRSMSVSSAEALIRARHPERGVIQPADLLPPAGDPLYNRSPDWGYYAQRRPRKGVNVCKRHSWNARTRIEGGTRGSTRRFFQGAARSNCRCTCPARGIPRNTEVKQPHRG